MYSFKCPFAVYPLSLQLNNKYSIQKSWRPQRQLKVLVDLLALFGMINNMFWFLLFLFQNLLKITLHGNWNDTPQNSYIAFQGGLWMTMGKPIFVLHDILWSKDLLGMINEILWKILTKWQHTYLVRLVFDLYYLPHFKRV